MLGSNKCFPMYFNKSEPVHTRGPLEFSYCSASDSLNNKTVHDGKVITSPKDIANIANAHYINKIKKLNMAMSHEKRDPIAPLSQLIPRYQSTEFKIKFISLKENLKNTKSTGDDAISKKI